MTTSNLRRVRAEFADRVLARAGVENARLRAAFGAVPRERFLGPGPWLLSGGLSYLRTATDDPREVYVDALIALDPVRGLNNGEPSGHAHWIDALELKEGERVDHIGAGTGYYSAILAELVGPSGRVEAYEIDADLAVRAREALADRPNVKVRAVSGVEAPLPEADAIYVNAGVSAPQPVWIDALALGGRLVFPLTGSHGGGGMLKITRAGGRQWPARMISGAGFIDLVGGRDLGEARAVEEAFRRGGDSEVRWFARDDETGNHDWLRGEGWRLTR